MIAPVSSHPFPTSLQNHARLESNVRSMRPFNQAAARESGGVRTMLLRAAAQLAEAHSELMRYLIEYDDGAVLTFDDAIIANTASALERLLLVKAQHCDMLEHALGGRSFPAMTPAQTAAIDALLVALNTHFAEFDRV